MYFVLSFEVLLSTSVRPDKYMKVRALRPLDKPTCGGCFHLAAVASCFLETDRYLYV